jgi:class 3 adenylate cyclase/tetratricopeptide (TPR) repeat protein
LHLRLLESRLPADPLDGGERRQLTILFCDLVGSMALAARLDPEDWQDVLRAFQTRAGEVIERHGGHVAQYLGDGLLVYFGWPTTWDDAAERAVRAALGLLDAAAGVPADGAPLVARVGLHTGPVVVSALGGEGRTEMLALGDVPNVAARVQGAAEPGTVLISAATQRLVAGMFVVEERGAQTLAGVSEPLSLYRVVQPSGVRSRLDAAAGRLTRFVGREVEVATLVERWERAQDGEGQNVLLLGEAGVGKSRLAYQLRERLAEVPHTWLECGASPYTQGTPFHPLIALASQALGFAPGDSPQARLARVESGLGALATPRTVALIADFLGLPVPAPLDLSPDIQRRETIDLLAQWNLAQGAVQPQVLVVEDLHWCDASSLEVLGRLVAQSATARVLLLTTARPEFTPPWPARENTTTLPLARLKKRQAREMIVALAGRALTPETLDALVARADGVPLFVEELTKSVVEPGSVRGIEAIPATLADSLMARLDRLGTAKDVAQRAAVLGREFAYPLLEAIAGCDEASLRDNLARLVAAEVLFVRGVPPEATYTFKHALVQEAACESLLKRTRQQLHGRVVDVLQQTFPTRATAEPELVARHAEAAGRIAEAVACYQRAGERAQARSAHEEAIRHFEHAIELLVTRPEGRERDVSEAALQLVLAESRAVALGYTSPAVEAAHERARVLCEAVGDARGLGFALSGLAVYSYNSGQAERAFGLAARALANAQQIDDEELLLRAHCDYGLVQVYRGEFASALSHLDAVHVLHRPGVGRAVPSATGNPGVRALSASGWVLWALGFPDRALERAREGVARARELAHPFNVAHALLFEAVVHALRRDLAAQRERAAEVIALSETHGFPYWRGVGITFHAAARVAAGDRDAVADVRTGFALTAATGGRGGAPASLAQLGQAYLAAGLLDDARAAVEGGLAMSEQTGQPLFDANLRQLAARILLARGGAPADAEAMFWSAIEIARRQQTRSFELRAATGLAQLLRDTDRSDEARALLAPLYLRFTEGFATADLVAARTLLESLG